VAQAADCPAGCDARGRSWKLEWQRPLAASAIAADRPVGTALCPPPSTQTQWTDATTRPRASQICNSEGNIALMHAYGGTIPARARHVLDNMDVTAEDVQKTPQRRRRRLTAPRSPPQMRWADASACQPCAGPHTRASSTTDTAGRLASSPSTAAMPLPSASPKPRTPGDCHSQTSSSILPS